MTDRVRVTVLGGSRGMYGALGVVSAKTAAQSHY
jgi:hypothetical protein